MALKHTHNHTNTKTKLSKKSIAFYIDIDMIMIAIADITYIYGYGPDHVEVIKELKKLKPRKIEKRIIENLKNGGRDYFDFYGDKNDLSDQVKEILKEKAHQLFPQLV